MQSRAAAARTRTLRRDAKLAKSSRQTSKPEQILARCFDQQRALINDPARRKAARCAARAGKTYTASAYLVATALRIAGAQCLYIALSLKSAKRLLWRALKRINKEFEIGPASGFNNSELIWTLPNGSTITLGGADNDEAIEKYRGSPWHLVIIDECKSFNADRLDELITEVIEPRLMDYLGTLVLIGTPGDVLAGQFYEITGPEATQVVVTDVGSVCRSLPYDHGEAERFAGVRWEWSLHNWTLEQNVAAPNIWQEALAEKERKGWSDDNPIWRREYLGEWQPDTGKRVYAFNAVRDCWTPGPPAKGNPFGLPKAESSWEYSIGIDLGYKDAFALEVFAYSDTERVRYQVYEFHRKKLSVTKMATAIKEAVELCGGEVQAMVADYAGTGEAILDEFAETHQLYVDRAQKNEKRDYIELWNAEISETPGQWKFLKKSKLAEEMANNQWDEKNPMKEKTSLERDCADAGLYNSREVRRLHRFKVPEKTPAPGTPEAYHRQAEAERERAIARRKQQKKGEWFDTPYAAESDAAMEGSFEWD